MRPAGRAYRTELRSIIASIESAHLVIRLSYRFGEHLMISVQCVAYDLPVF
jgi:hypothetical protein